MKPTILAIPALLILASTVAFGTEPFPPLAATHPGDLADQFDWPRFRGPDGNSSSKETAWHPEALNTPNILWKVNVGAGHSAVAIKGDRLYTMGNRADTDIVSCLNIKDGKEVWTHSYPCNADDQPGPHATPTIDGGSVYTLSRSGHLFCLNGVDGKVKWQKNLLSDFRFKEPGWGLAGSPVVFGDLLLINAGEYGLCLKEATGDKEWASPAGTQGGHATPVLYKQGGKDCIAMLGSSALHGIEPATGKKLWSYKWETHPVRPMNIPDPIVFDGKVFISTGSYQNWDGANNGGFRDLFVKDLWKDQPGMPDKAEAMAARNGKLYLTFRSYNFRRSDVTDWRAFLTKLSAAGDRIGKAIWEKTDKNVRERAAAWLAGNDPEDKALAAPNYYTPDVRDAVAGTINGMLTDKTLVDGGAEMTALMLQAAVRRKVEAMCPQEVAVMKSDFVAVLDAENGKVLKTIPVPAPSGIVAVSDSLLCVLSGTDSVAAVDPATGGVNPVLTRLTDARCLAVDAAGRIYVGEGEPSVQIKVFTPDGKPALTIGKQGGRPRLGPWVKEGTVDIKGLAVDPNGKLWVAESNFFPKRFSVWNNQTGAFIREFFGSTHYGASGGAINPDDPNLMVGEGCEWRIDPATGRAECLGVFEDGAGRDYESLFHKFARFCRGTNGKLYLAATLGADTHVWERLGDGAYALRATFGRNDKDKTTVFWSDENGDQQKQDEEKTVVPMQMSFNGYLNFSLGLNTDLTLYAGVLDPKTNRWDRGARIRLARFTPCGAPKWDPSNPHFLPPLEGPMPSPANDLVLSCDSEKQLFNCYDVASGNLRWSYPNTFHGVHGSHNAPGPQAGLIRGAFGTVGSVTLPDPVGSAWVINSNVGEWHMLSRDGFYLTRLFQGDFSKVQWPEKAVPGAVLDHVPAGEGGEDFGGSITQAKDGKLYVTAGKTANWNVEVVGLETVKPLGSGTLRLEEKDLKLAEAIRSELVQRSAGLRRCEVRKQTPVFTGDLAKDFGNEIVFKKQDDAEVRSAVAWDDTVLYLGWRVADATPWTNGADSPEFMYARGDTVDFQLGTDPEADENRAEAAMGDLRLSIGNFRDKPTAVLYRKIAEQKNPRTFSSGVVSDYVMDSVVELQDAKIEVKKDDRWHVVEIAVPLATLGMKPFAGMKLSGDFGATHGTPAGDDTLLRTYWNNHATGLVNDEVFELKMEPKNWGQILFTE